MIQCREYSLRFQVGHKLVNVAPKPLNLPVLLFVDVQNSDVDGHLVLGKDGGYFFSDDQVWTIGERERAINRVVIRDCNQIHSAGLGPAVNEFRRVVGFVQNVVDGINRGLAGKQSMDMCIKLHAASSYAAAFIVENAGRTPMNR